MILKNEIRDERAFLDLWWQDVLHDIWKSDPSKLVDSLESSYQYYRESLNALYEDCAATGHQFYKDQCEACLIMAGSHSG